MLLLNLTKKENKVLDKIKKSLGLLPKGDVNALGIQVGLQGEKIVIKFDRKVDTVYLDRMQLTNLLAALASRAQILK